MNGQGTFIWHNGDGYIGDWKDSKKNGHGTLTLANGDKYVGDWTSGMRNGQGTYTFADGDKYVGQWMGDKRNGQGTFTGYDGSKIVGEWKNDKFLYGDKIAPPLLIAFINLSEKDRKKVQSVLLDLGFYNSLIDGIYGKGTSDALTAYYEKSSGVGDLKNTENAIRLLSDLLKIN